jgi:hypothetical protein
MCRPGLVSLFLCALAFVAVQAQTTPPTVDSWIQRLGGDTFADREAAAKALDDLGAAALPALQKACASSDAEIRRRARRLTENIEKRLNTARLLAPKQITLACKDAPVRDVLAELSKKSGYVIRVEGGQGRLAEKRLTLQLGPVPFWEAFALVCDKAGLKEYVPPAANPQMNRGGNSITINGGPARLPTKDIMKLADKDVPPEIRLIDGTPDKQPTQVTGNLRIKALPAGTPIPKHTKQTGETLVALEITPEPNLIWKDVVAVRVDQAIDRQDRKLVQRWLPFKLGEPAAPATGGGIVIINGNIITSNMGGASDRGNQRMVPVALKLPDGAARELKELSGIITALVLAPPEKLITVDNVLKSAGQTFKAKRAGVIRVLEVAAKDGEVRMRLDVEAPPRAFDEPTSRPNLNMNIIINGKPLGFGGDHNLSAANFALLDKDGKAFEITRAMDTGRGTGVAHELELTFRPRSGQGEALRFTYTDRCGYVIDVPFSLKNIALE